jgi:hypothetical protein
MASPRAIPRGPEDVYKERPSSVRCSFNSLNNVCFLKIGKSTNSVSGERWRAKRLPNPSARFVSAPVLILPMTQPLF